MIHLVVQEVVFTSPSTIERDVKSIEDSVNTFLRDPVVQPDTTEFYWFEVSGKTYVAIKINYNLRPK